MVLFALAVLVFAAGDSHVRPFPAASAASSATPIVAATEAVATPTAVVVATATPVVAREVLLGTDRNAATAAVETVSLGGGGEALVAIADFLGRWQGDKEMERRGRSALTRLPIDASSVVRVLQDDPEAKHRAWAAWTAGTHEMAMAGDALLKALKDADAVVRARAVVALALLGDPRAQDPLMKIVVHDPDPDTRQRASDALTMLAAPHPQKLSIEPALTKLNAADAFARLDGAHELEKAHDRAAVGPLLKLLDGERDVEVRRAAIGALAALGDEIAVPALIAIARRDSLSVREFAIGALAALDDARAVDPLVVLTKDREPSIRRYSLRALAFLHREGTLGAILEGLGDPVAEVRSEAIKGIAKLGDRSAADRIAARVTSEPDPEIRQFACATLGALGTIGNPQHERALVKLLEDEEPLVKTAAVAALAKIGTRAGSEKPLVRVLDAEKKKKKGESDPVLLRLAEDAVALVRAR